MKTLEQIVAILEEATSDAAELLAKKIKNGKASAADINSMRAMASDLGVSLTFNKQRTPVGDKVMESLADIDPALLN